MEDEIRYPKLNDTLLRETGGKKAKVLFADWMAGKWSWYSDGYKLAADKVVDQISGEPWDDQLINPVIFMYRHFVELKLKEIIIELDSLSRTQITDKEFTKHGLVGLWSYLAAHLNCIRNAFPDREILPSLKYLIAELDNLDPDSMHFRYAHDKNFQPMNVPRCLSLDHFKTMMDVINNGLEYIKAGIDLEREQRALESQFAADNY